MEEEWKNHEEILQLLFGENGPLNLYSTEAEELSPTSIRWLKNYPTYFSPLIYSNQISFKQIRMLLNNNENEKRNIIENATKSNNANAIFKRLYEYSKVDKNNIKKILSTYIALIIDFPSDFDNSIHIFLLTASEAVKDEQLLFNELLTIVFEESDIKTCHQLIFFTILDKLSAANTFFNYDTEKTELIKNKAQELILFLELSAEGMGREHVKVLNRIYQNIMAIDQVNSHELLQNYSNLITKKFLKPFLESVVWSDGAHRAYQINPFFSHLFGGKNEISARIFNAGDLPDYVQEFKRFFRLCSISQSTNGIYFTFNFRHLNVNQQLLVSLNLTQVIIEYQSDYDFLFTKLVIARPLTHMGFEKIIKGDKVYLIISIHNPTYQEDLVNLINQELTTIIDKQKTFEIKSGELQGTIQIEHEKKIILKYFSIESS
jgi:hypothetical protein